VRQGAVSVTTLATARSLARERNTTVCDILLANGQTRPLDQARASAHARNMPFADLIANPPPRDLLAFEQIGDYLAEDLIPIGQGPDGPRFAAAGRDLKPFTANGRLKASHTWARAPIAFTARRDIREAIMRRFPRALSERAALGLARRAPELSAARRMTIPQAVVMVAVSALAGAGIALDIGTALVTLNIILAVAFAAVIALKAMSLPQAAAPFADETADYPRVADNDLPVYTILVPLYGEANMIEGLAEALLGLDYPPERLDIKLIFEADDAETLAMAKSLPLPGNVEFIVAPRSDPQTKPKALNFALPFVRGDFVVIYDAEDRPEPGQLRQALHVFANGAPDLACVQARLGFYNANENWLTRQFEIEYAALFDLMLPMLRRYRLPIPLGGTSNHFRADILKKVGAWDPFNVTEDADLGIRLARLGHSVEVTGAMTTEEASNNLGGWMRQRKRWLKGWMQTWLVHMRQPVRLWRELGARGFFAFQVLIGGVILAGLVHPFFFTYAPYALASAVADGSIASFSGLALTALNATVLVSGYVVAVIAGVLAVRKRGKLGLQMQALMTPVYWLLISGAAYCALWQFLTRPFYWAKTAHGLSRLSRPHPAGRPETLH